MNGTLQAIVISKPSVFLDIVVSAFVAIKSGNGFYD